MTKTVFDTIDPVVLARVRAMRFFDDEFMSAAFSDDIKMTQFLIRILLNRNDLTVTKSMSQVQKTNLFGKSVKLDVVAEDIFTYKVRASIGAQSALITEDLSIENIIAKADKLMYSEKSSKKRSVIR